MRIETSALRKTYGATVAVDGISLAVGPGEVFAFLGPNGAGKTTTIKMLLGLVKPTGGEARVLGQAPGNSAAMRRIGFLPEHFRFPPWLTAAGFLDLHADLYGLSAAERRSRIPRLLERVGLADRARSRLGEFSKGMLQRVGMAQALLNDPALVFLDEPTSGLDPLGRMEVRDLIRELRAAGVTIFLNSHFLSEVEVTCDRVAIVKRGRVVRAGTLDELTRGALEVEIRASGLTDELVRGLARWGEIADSRWPQGVADGIQPMADGRWSTADSSQPQAEPITEYALRNTEYALRNTEYALRNTEYALRSTLHLTIPDEDVIPAIADYLVRGGAQLYALSPQRPSLEELFVRAMREEPA